MMLEVALRISNTTQVVWRNRRTSTAWKSAGVKRTSTLFIFCAANAGPHVVEKVLLGVARIWTEVRLCEIKQPLRRRAAARKIELPQSFQNPNVQRKGLLKMISEKQHAVGNLSTDPG